MCSPRIISSSKLHKPEAVPVETKIKAANKHKIEEAPVVGYKDQLADKRVKVEPAIERPNMTGLTETIKPAAVVQAVGELLCTTVSSRNRLQNMTVVDSIKRRGSPVPVTLIRPASSCSVPVKSTTQVSQNHLQSNLQTSSPK